MIRIVRDRWVAEDLTVETFWRTYKARAPRSEPQFPRLGALESPDAEEGKCQSLL